MGGAVLPHRHSATIDSPDSLDGDPFLQAQDFADDWNQESIVERVSTAARLWRSSTPRFLAEVHFEPVGLGAFGAERQP